MNFGCSTHFFGSSELVHCCIIGFPNVLIPFWVFLASNCNSDLQEGVAHSFPGRPGIRMAPKAAAPKKQPVVSKAFSCSELVEGQQKLLKVKREGLSQEDLQKQIKDNHVLID